MQCIYITYVQYITLILSLDSGTRFGERVLGGIGSR